MFSPVVQSASGITLLGGGPVRPDDILLALGFAPDLVAADGGADKALAENLPLQAVIGDFDSLSDEVRTRYPAEFFHQVAEQDSTDFEKCLARIQARFVLGLGFLGGRLDHELVACNALLAHSSFPVVLIGAKDIVFAPGPRLSMKTAPGQRFSLVPLMPFSGRSKGLKWPIDGLDFAPGGRMGTSNETTGPVQLKFDSPGALVIMPKAALPFVIAALTG